MTNLSADELDGHMVEIVSGDQPHYVGEAVDRLEHGWIAVQLDDDRVLYPVSPKDVILRPEA